MHHRTAQDRDDPVALSPRGARDVVPHSPPDTPRRLAARALHRQRARIAAGVALLSGHQLSEALVPVVIGVTIDAAVLKGSLASLGWCLAALAAVFVALSMCWRYGSRCIEIATMTEAHLLRTEIADHLLGGPVDTSRATGELLAIASSDADQAATTIEWRADIAAAAAGIVVAAVVLLGLNVWLGLLVVLGVPLVLIALRGFAPAITRRSLEAQESAGRTTALAADLMRGLRAIRGIGAVGPASDRYRASSQATLGAQMHAAVAKSAQTGAGAALNGVFLAVVAAAAGLLTNRGDLTIGELVTVVGLAQFIAEPVGSMAVRVKELAVAHGSAQRVVEVLNASGGPSADPGPAPIPLLAPLIRLKSLSHGSFRDLTLDIVPGELVAVASGNPRDSVAINALLSTAAAHDGQLEVGGISLRDLPRDTLRATILAEPHGIDLFEGTIQQNLFALARPEDLRHDHVLPVDAPVLSATAADELLESQPGGLAQPVVDRGVSLSGGQRQRLALARAMIADPPVLLLCEPTTAVDAVTEEQIARGIVSLRHSDPERPRTTIIVSNSPALLAAAHRVLFLEHGRIADEGTHRELVERNAAYRGLVLR